MKILIFGFTLAFVVLKLTNFITWAWCWVLSPLWIGFILWLLIVVIGIWLAIKNEKIEEKIRKQRPPTGLMAKLKDIQEAQERLHNEKKQQR